MAAGLLWSPLEPPEHLAVGPDDLLRVHLVRAHLEGRPFTDALEPRLAPPEGTHLPWSPIASLPLYAAARLLSLWSAPEVALSRAVAWVPPLLGAAYVGALLFALLGAVPLAGGLRAPPILLALTPSWALWEYSPGRTDHHGLGVLLGVLAIGCALRALRPEPPRVAAPACGALLGLALAISLESLVPAFALALAFAGAFVLGGGRRRAGAAASVALACGLVAWGAATLTVSPGPLERALCDRLSAPHLAALAVCACGALCLVAFAPRLRSVRARSLALGGPALLAVAVFASWTPACLLGPYAVLDPGARAWLAQVVEARGIVSLLASPRLSLALGALALPLAGALVLLSSWRASAERADARWLALATPCLLALALLFWQVRVAEYAHAFAVLALVPAAASATGRVPLVHSRPRAYALWLAYPFGVLALTAGPPLLFPFAAGTPPRCVDDAVLASLNDPALFGPRPQVVAAPIDDAPLLLYRTEHSVLAGGYHPADAAIADQWRLFGADSAAVSRVLTERAVDVLILCEAGFAPYGLGGAHPGVVQSWLARDALPPWLVPVPAPSGDVRLYRVERARLARLDARASP